MKSLRSVSAFAVFPFSILLIVLAAAQSNPVAYASQANLLLPDAQQPVAGKAARLGRQLAPAAQKPVKFAKAVAYPTGGFTADSVAVGDLTGDGHPDLVVSNYCLNQAKDCVGGVGQVSVLLGNGDGTFQPAVTYDSGGINAYSVAIADLNGDGKPDVVVANFCQDQSCANGGVTVFLGNGDGTLQPGVSYSAGWEGVVSLAIGDVNGDGHPDLVVANQCPACGTGGVSVLLGNGDGTFRAPVTYDSGGINAVSVAIGDLNGDGHPDLVVSNYCFVSGGSCTGYSGVSVLLGNGDGTFQAPATYNSGGDYVGQVVVGDVNGDAHPDVVVANACPNSGCSPNNGVVSVLLGNGDGTLQPAVSYNSGGYYSSFVAVGDVNGDGHPDVVMTNSYLNSKRTLGGVSILLGNGDGTFQTPVSCSSGGYYAWSVAIADMNNDGRPDIAVTNSCTTLRDCEKNVGVGSVSALLNLLIVTTTTKLTSSPNPSRVNQPVTFTATVTSNPAIPNGETVTFYNGPTKIGTGSTTSGVATLTTSFSTTGTYTIKASYPGDAFHKPSSGKVRQVVNP